MKKSNDTRIGCLDSLNFSKIQGPVFRSRRIVYLKENLGVTIDLTDASQSTVVMNRLLIESSRLSPGRSIDDEGSGFVHIA